MTKFVNYRKFWEAANNTTIPKGYHIHHIDGNHNNNDINNLVCVSAEEHHNIHLVQGDIVALNGKFIQGASEAGKLGGTKLRPRWEEGNKKKTLSDALKKSYTETGGSKLRGKNISDSHKKNISIKVTGEKNPMYGKTHTDEVKKILSESSSKRIGTKSNRYMGPIKATNIDTGEVTVMRGNLDIKAKGFHPVGIQDCLTGRTKTHRNCTIERLAKEVNL